MPISLSGPAVHSLGPCHIYARLRTVTTGTVTTGSPVYLGTCDTTPKIERQVSKLPVMNDISGREKPFATIYDAEEHVVSGVLSRFDYSLYRLLADQAGSPAVKEVGDLGSDTRLERGSIITGVSDAELMLVYEFTANFGGVNHPLARADQPRGRRYFAVEFDFAEDPTGTRATLLPFAATCRALYDSATRRMRLYTEDPAELPAVPTPT